MSGVIQIAAGDSHSVALKSDGTVVVWGYNQFGQVGNGTINTTGCNCVQYPTQTTNTLMGTIVQISAGAYHNVAVNTAGDVYAWGYGGDGRIGDGNTADALIPRKTSIVSNVVRVETHGATQTLARQRDGAIYVWGQNVFGQIGNGTMNNQLTPLNISAVAGTGGNLGTNIAVFGVGVYSSYASTLPETLTPAGTSTLRGDQFSVTFPASTIAGTTQVRTFDPTATGLTVSSGYTIQANSTGYDITSTAQFTGTATVCLAFPNVIDPLTFNRLYILHDDDFDGTLDSRAMSRNYQKRQLCSTTSHFSPFVVALGPAAPTAGEVFVSGRVITDNGRGLLNAIVTLTDSNGVTRTARTSAFGYYHFDDLTAGETVTISVSAKKYSFAPQIVNLSDSLSEVNFTGEAPPMIVW